MGLMCAYPRLPASTRVYPRLPASTRVYPRLPASTRASPNALPRALGARRGGAGKARVDAGNGAGKARVKGIVKRG